MGACDELARDGFVGVGVGQVRERVVLRLSCGVAKRVRRDGGRRGCYEVRPTMTASEAFRDDLGAQCQV